MKHEQLPSIEDFVKSASCETIKQAAGFLGNIAGAIAQHPYLTVGGLGALGAGAGALHGMLANKPQPPMGFDPDSLAGAAASGVTKGVGGEIGKSIVGLLGNIAHGMYRAVRRDPLEDMVAGDPVLEDADPADLEEAYATMKRFAPTLSTDVNAVRAFLREAVTSGGGVNYNTIKLLTDTENAAQEGGVW